MPFAMVHRFLSARSSRTKGRFPGAFSFFVAWSLLLSPNVLSAQMVEERHRDDPPIERPADLPEETTPELNAAEELIVSQTNDFRTEQELDSVKPNANLNQTAQYFADFMARTGKYGHQADGKRPSKRADNHGYDYCIIAENIAYQFRSTGFSTDNLAERFVSGWKNSPEHRENMLDPDVTEIGVAIARKEGSPEYFAVQMFGHPKSKSISFEVRNESETKVEYTVSRRSSEKSFPLPPRLRRTHRRCRPTKIEFTTAEEPLDAKDGAEYVVQESSDGKVKIVQR